MKRVGVALVLIAAFAAAAVAVVTSRASSSDSPLPLKQVARVTLPGPGNRFDYTSLDPTTGRLYIAHMNAGELLVFDVHKRKVLQTIRAGVHGVIAVPQIHRVYASATDARQMFTIDSRSGKVLNRAPGRQLPRRPRLRPGGAESVRLG